MGSEGRQMGEEKQGPHGKRQRAAPPRRRRGGDGTHLLVRQRWGRRHPRPAGHPARREAPQRPRRPLRLGPQRRLRGRLGAQEWRLEAVELAQHAQRRLVLRRAEGKLASYVIQKAVQLKLQRHPKIKPDNSAPVRAVCQKTARKKRGGGEKHSIGGVCGGVTCGV